MQGPGLRDRAPGKRPQALGPLPSAQHDDAPSLGVDSAVVTVGPDTCKEAEGFVTPRGPDQMPEQMPVAGMAAT